MATDRAEGTLGTLGMWLLNLWRRSYDRAQLDSKVCFLSIWFEKRRMGCSSLSFMWYSPPLSLVFLTSSSLQVSACRHFWSLFWIDCSDHHTSRRRWRHEWCTVSFTITITYSFFSNIKYSGWFGCWLWVPYSFLFHKTDLWLVYVVLALVDIGPALLLCSPLLYICIIHMPILMYLMN